MKPLILKTDAEDDDKYINLRIEAEDLQQGDPVKGTVKFDWPTFFWLAPMATFGVIGAAFSISISHILVFIISTAVTLCLGHSLGMHRRFIHRSYQCARPLELLLIHFGTLVGLAGPLGMLRTHDLRDWAQRQANCHPYLSHDMPWYKDMVWQLFCRLDLDQPPQIEAEPEITNDRAIAWMQRTWHLQQLPWAILFYAMGGWAWVCWGICLRVTVSVFGHWFIGYFAHNTGHRSWHIDGAAVQGHNVAWASLLTMGECWHNNHHAFPYSAKLGLLKGQWDPGWWVLKGFEKLGWVSDFVLPQTTELRRELIQIK